MLKKILNTAFCIAALCLPFTSYGALIINFQDNGPNINVSMSGTLDTSGATTVSGFSPAFTYSNIHAVAKNAPWTVNTFSGLLSENSSSGNLSIFSETVSGSTSAISGGDGGYLISAPLHYLRIYAPDQATYASGFNINFSMNDVNLSDLGFTSTVFTLPNGDTVSFTASSSSVPEPSSPVTVAIAGMMMFFANRRRKQTMLNQNDRALEYLSDQ